MGTEEGKAPSLNRFEAPSVHGMDHAFLALERPLAHQNIGKHRFFKALGRQT
jgi:hypothetical protein